MDKAAARNFLYGFARDHYTLATQAVLGASGALRYSGGPDRTQPADNAHWARVVALVADEYQETLRVETRRWTTIGTVFVQLFAPVTDSQAQVRLDTIAELVRNAFRLYQGADIEFTNAVINDAVNNEPQWLRANVTSTYQYRQFM